jgi:hypothetical protein
MAAYHQKKDKPHGHTRYGEEDAKRWREMLRAGMTREAISQAENVGMTTISRILENY